MLKVVLRLRFSSAADKGHDSGVQQAVGIKALDTKGPLHDSIKKSSCGDSRVERISRGHGIGGLPAALPNTSLFYQSGLRFCKQIVTHTEKWITRRKHLWTLYFPLAYPIRRQEKCVSSKTPQNVLKNVKH